MKKKNINLSIKGIKDISIDELKIWDYYFDILNNILISFNYSKIQLSILEKIDIFKNIIKNDLEYNVFIKKTYNLFDKNNKVLILNPEGTIPCIKYCILNNLYYKNKINKLYYFNPIFRYENTQYMRYRKFYQFGIEIFGSNKIEYEIELIYIIFIFFKKINILKYLKLNINNIGNYNDRINYCDNVINYLKNKFNYNNNDFIIKEIKKYDLSIFYKKKDFFYNKKIPVIYDYVNKYSKEKMFNFINFLKFNNINYNINYFLFRGLNYYNDIIFEWNINKISICGGGRYDNLVEKMYNKNIYALGLAIGWNRLIKLIYEKNENKYLKLNNIIYIYISCINFLCIYTMINIYNIISKENNKIIIVLDYSLKTLKKNLELSFKKKYNICILIYKLKNNNNIKIYIKNFNYKYTKISSIKNILKDLKIK
ncbi:ATP phosphoribosyltransferase regulatory subunit [Candidatus Nardonella dryophthoridicola]|uniref:ATP phosphoribosyltransferase regulatory subunit n=1 Tax=Candidatus Nardonella dryophthoridicola TaxID=1971485 RepID=UPI001AD8970A|nr:ATP phosphoribosyltransferase regulatory subunit [Candidatus Nardonella dryophthoridicola]QTJ62811.1 ATP phosphoribosyltransferase regulatory subunit [Candidatus Nardonella dryophthoridicola]